MPLKSGKSKKVVSDNIATDNNLFADDYITREEYDRLCKELGVEG